MNGPTNQAKGDADAASGCRRTPGFRCRYVATQIAVKATYGLWVTQTHAVMAQVLTTCPGQPLPA